MGGNLGGDNSSFIPVFSPGWQRGDIIRKDACLYLAWHVWTEFYSAFCNSWRLHII